MVSKLVSNKTLTHLASTILNKKLTRLFERECGNYLGYVFERECGKLSFVLGSYLGIYKTLNQLVVEFNRILILNCHEN